MGAMGREVERSMPRSSEDKLGGISLLARHAAELIRTDMQIGFSVGERRRRFGGGCGRRSKRDNATQKAGNRWSHALVQSLCAMGVNVNQWL